MQAIVVQHLLEPIGSDEDVRARPYDILNRIIDHGHQWDDGAEGDKRTDRYHQKPGFIILPLIHQTAPST
jgi:hypothetical protein